MCYALIRVTYKGEKGKPETLDVSSEADLAIKIAEIQGRDQVLRLGVFKCDYHVERTETWVSTPYNAPGAAS
jgi:hypothetical protein